MAVAVDAGHRLRAVPSRHGRDATASAASGATSAAAWAASTQALAAAAKRPRRRDPLPTPRWRSILVAATARSPASPWPTATSSTRPSVASNADAQRHLPEAARPEGAAGRLRRRGRADRLRQRLAEDQRRPVASCPNFTRLPGNAARPAAPRHDPHLPRPGLHRARLRRRQVRPAVARPDPRMHACPSVVDPTVAPPGKHLMSMFIQYAPYKLQGGRPGTTAQGQVRRPLLRHR